MRKLYTTSFCIIALTLLFFACSGSGNNKPTNNIDKGPAKIKGGITFSYQASMVPQKVFLAGSFNGWHPNHPKFQMERVDDSKIWQVTIKLAPGKYQYKFVVDGEWIPDPNNSNSIDDGFGKKNSVIIVK